METNDLKIQQLVGYPGLVVQKDKHSKLEKTLPKPTLHCVDPTALLGIEIEVENMKNNVFLDYYWKAKADHSLRNNGLEFTSIPLRGNQVEHALRYLNERMCQDNKPDFSARTSVHVHLNVRDMSWKQIKSLVLLYSLFEKHFFNIAGTRRENSIFCVPLNRSTQLKALPTLENGGYKWHKYNALNLGTILGDDDVPTYGTIEFRHLYGTNNVELLMNWVNNILLLRKASYLYKYDDLVDVIKNMNTSSEYTQVYLDVFKEYADLTAMTKYDFESSVSHIKLAYWANELLIAEPLLTGSFLFKDAPTNKAHLIKTYKTDLKWAKVTAVLDDGLDAFVNTIAKPNLATGGF